MSKTTERIQQGNFIYMLIGLLMLLVFAPVVSQYFPDNTGLIIQFTFMTIMFIGVWSLQNNKRWFIIGIVLTMLAILLSVINFFIQSPNIQFLSLGLVLIFCVLSVVLAMQQILFSGRISTNKLVGSICIYLLLGVIWALLYSFIDRLTVDAFNGLSAHANQQVIWEYIYFSFVTLSTLGYGDISPANEIARSLVYMEAICGQIYLAILVASLVGAHMSEQATKNK